MDSRCFLALFLLPCLFVQESVSQDAECFCVLPEHQPSFSGTAEDDSLAGSTLAGDCAELNGLYQEECGTCECGDIDLAVGLLNRNNVTLKLLPGSYKLSTVHVVESVVSVSIVGLGAVRENTVVECADKVGLAFVNVTNLTIENLAISNCGLRDENLAGISERAKELVVFNDTYSILKDVNRAVLVVYSTHVTFRNMVIRDTHGVGLTALNMLGESSLDGVHFTNNSGITLKEASSETQLLYNGTGGSAMFFYGDTTSDEAEIDNHLLIQNCLFENSRSSSNINSYVLVDSLFEIDDFQQFHFSADSRDTVYPLDGAAGMSLIFSHHSDYHTSVILNNTRFRRINHFDGGCMSVFFERASANTSVLLDGISFDDCRGENIGGGLLVGFGYPKAQRDIIYTSIEQSVVVRNTNFSDCRAAWGAGLAVMSIPTFFPSSILYQRLISLENCSWTNNRGSLGAAASFWEAKYHGVQRRFGMSITMTNCSFTENRIDSSDTPQFNSAVLNFDAVSVVFNGSTYFGQNKLSCIGATRSELIVYDHFFAEDTQVSFGGVLDFRDTSFFIMKKNSNVTFSNNKALWRGGAVSVNAFTPWPLYVYGGCFLHFDRFRACPDGNCYDPNNDGPYKITFRGNKARLLGHDIFGATFKFCPWVNTTFEGPETLTFFETKLSDIMQFSTSDLHGRDIINFYMTHAEVAENTTYPQEVMPGQLWNLDVTIYDFFNQSVPSVNTLYLPEPNGEVNITRGFSVDDNIVSYVESQESLRMVFNGTENEEIDFQFLAISRFQPVGSFNIKLSKCKAGFIYNSAMESCVCNPDLESLHETIQCNSDGTISRDVRLWVGVQNEGNITSFATSLCQFDYCNENVPVLHNLSDGSEQCQYNRTGMLCGECKEGLSRVFGSNQCKECENFWLFYIALYLLSGIVIVCGIFALQISVSSGYLNGPILYANLLSAYGNFIFPNNVLRYHDPIYVIFLFLNLEIGYETCYYDGMTQLGISGIKLLYPFYLLSIVIVIVIIGKAYPRFLRLESLKPVRAIATIWFLSFATLFQSCVDFLSIAVLDYKHNGTTTTDYRWLLDASVDFGRGWHGILVVLSVVVLVVLLLPQVIVNLLYRPLHKVRFTEKLLQKWWPLFDAWHNPFRANFRFWFGFQLLFRIITSSVLSSRQITAATFSFFVSVLELTTYTIFQAFVRPYKGWARNIFDLIFLFDLVILTMSSLYYQLLQSLESSQQDLATVIQHHYVTTECCLVVAFVLTLLLFTGFFLNRVGFLKYCIETLIPKAPLGVRKMLMALFKDAGYHSSNSMGENLANQMGGVEVNPSVQAQRGVVHFSVSLPSADESQNEDQTGQEDDSVFADDDYRQFRYSQYRESVFEHLR